jgi:hypothetical protein
MDFSDCENDLDICPTCGQYYELDFSHHRDDGCPVYVVSCRCTRKPRPGFFGTLKDVFGAKK